jgi:hypothetical protein
MQQDRDPRYLNRNSENRHVSDDWEHHPMCRFIRTNGARPCSCPVMERGPEPAPAWEPQEHEFTNHDGRTVLVKITQDGSVEVTYFDYDTAIVQHVVETWNDDGRAYSAGVTAIRPGRHVPSIPADF